ncbi:DUF4013 domain-containing protein [Halorubrum yunnanense]|uniref:DUF4013 domain-containing protein n=1 Tax=Halorubrum yunnanense TaxID=1526162 RepID=A0ABD5YEL7_9EURY|nr:DUF4013 domain-containing protein [Halorubrum yunnanense]
MIRGVSSALSRSADAAGVLVVGGLLTLLTLVVTPVWVGGSFLFPPLVVLAPLALAPAFVARGYLVRVVAGAGATGNREGAPPFVEWNELYRNGLKSALLSALLLAPLALLIGIAALGAAAVGTGVVDPSPAVAFVERALGPSGVPAVVGAGGGLLSVVTAAYLLAFAYVRPAALAAFAASGRLRDGLRPGRVAVVAGSGGYATAWAVAVGTLAAGYALAAPVVPLVVGLVFAFAVRVVAHGIYGRGAAGAIEFDDAGSAGVDGSEPAEPVPPTAWSGSPGAPASPPNSAGPPLDRPDGGCRRSPSEATPAVQTGRSVPFGDDRASPTADGDVDDFEWNVEVGAEGPATPADGGFEWGTRADPEDKS